MGERVPLQIGKASNKASAPNESVERLLNGYLDAAPQGKELVVVYGTPGRVLWCQGLDGPVRGMLEVNETLYVVAGTKLYVVAADAAKTEIGTIPGSDDVQMAGDGTNVVAVSGGEIYVYDGLTTGPVTDPDAPLASSVVWTDGYFLFGELNTQQFFISGLGTPMAYDALDYASAEWKPDNIVTPVTLRRTVYLAGTKSIEAQQNTGAADFPFSRYQDILIDVGVAGRAAITTTNDTMFWLASDGTIRRLDGLTASVISTAPVAKIIKGWADKAATVASSHVWGTHLFVVFRNPQGCIVWDQATERWAERGSYGQATWGVTHCATCYGSVLFGSPTEGKIYRLDDDALDEDGAPLEFEMVTPFAYVGGKLFTIDELEVMPQAGVGSQTLDPAITCERTQNGQDWSAPQIRRLGKAGQRDHRVLFGLQGEGRAMAFRLRITDPVKRAILAVYADVDPEV